MTNSYNDLLIKKTRFSFSSLTSFDTCRWGWKLNYLDSENKIDNFYSEYGNVIHEVMEGYWKGTIPFEDLVKAYKKAYKVRMKTPAPPYPVGMTDRYYLDGITFFETFDIKREHFEPLFIEDKIDDALGRIKIVVKPDLVIKNKKTGDVILVDYKTANPTKNHKWDLVKIDGYERQMLLYAYFIEKSLKIKVDKIALLFTRLGTPYYIENSPQKTKEVLKWFRGTVKKIKEEKLFTANTKNKYFCNVICSVREACEFREK